MGYASVDALRSYLLQARQELAARLCDRIYPVEPETQQDGTPTPAERQGQRVTKPSKWWMSFQKRKSVAVRKSRLCF
jgi:actin related protein 2/3 complex subunit 3